METSAKTGYNIDKVDIQYVHVYRTEGNFYTAQTFAVFVDDPTTAYINIAESFNDPVCTVLSMALSQK